MISTPIINYSGHGVIQIEGPDGPQIIASVTGYVERVNKLITIRPHLQRYIPEVGDVVVGRVNGILDKKWILDINARQSGTLQISAINLPGGQRKRTDEDALQMRAILKESDLVSAEVQRLMPDRTATLHTRSVRYGKLGYGMLLQVSAGLIKRQKQHFHTLEDLKIDLVLGVNGYIWIAPMETAEERVEKQKDLDDNTLHHNEDGKTTGNYGHNSKLNYQEYDQNKIQQDTFESIARLRNAIRLLDMTNTVITIDSILFIYNETIDKGINVVDMIKEEYVRLLTQSFKTY